MTETANIHDSIYLFFVGNEPSSYARIVRSYRRKTPATRDQAWEDIESSKAEVSWEELPSAKDVSGIDIVLPAGKASLVFVVLLEEYREVQAGSEDQADILHIATTYFGDEMVRQLEIRGNPKTPLIKQAESHQLPKSDYATVCSFEVDSPAVMGELGPNSPISRFPIVFDFIDSDDGISPVFKKPHGHKHSSADEAISPFFGHGGIHPPSGASMIVLQ